MAKSQKEQAEFWPLSWAPCLVLAPQWRQGGTARRELGPLWWRVAVEYVWSALNLWSNPTSIGQSHHGIIGWRRVCVHGWHFTANKPSVSDGLARKSPDLSKFVSASGWSTGTTVPQSSGCISTIT